MADTMGCASTGGADRVSEVVDTSEATFLRPPRRRVTPLGASVVAASLSCGVAPLVASSELATVVSLSEGVASVAFASTRRVCCCCCCRRRRGDVCFCSSSGAPDAGGSPTARSASTAGAAARRPRRRCVVLVSSVSDFALTVSPSPVSIAAADAGGRPRRRRRPGASASPEPLSAFGRRAPASPPSAKHHKRALPRTTRLTAPRQCHARRCESAGTRQNAICPSVAADVATEQPAGRDGPRGGASTGRQAYLNHADKCNSDETDSRLLAWPIPSRRSPRKTAAAPEGQFHTALQPISTAGHRWC